MAVAGYETFLFVVHGLDFGRCLMTIPEGQSQSRARAADTANRFSRSSKGSEIGIRENFVLDLRQKGLTTSSNSRDGSARHHGCYAQR